MEQDTKKILNRRVYRLRKLREGLIREEKPLQAGLAGAELQKARKELYEYEKSTNRNRHTKANNRDPAVRSRKRSVPYRPPQKHR